MEDKEEEISIYYSLSGREQKEIKDAFARKTNKSFYVVELNGNLYQKDILLRKQDKEKLVWRKVGAECFRHYLTYLSTNKDLHYRLADRNRVD